VTLNRLCDILELLRPQYGRHRVSVAKDSFRDNRENDGCIILMIVGVDVRWIRDAGDDGGFVINKDGTERGRTTVILHGDSYEREQP
jgi:hypothetical protein